MDPGRPAPGEELNLGPETVPRPAATVIVLRGGAERVEKGHRIGHVHLRYLNPLPRNLGDIAWIPRQQWLSSGAGHVHRVSGALQAPRHKVRNPFFVLDHEDSHVSILLE